MLFTHAMIPHALGACINSKDEVISVAGSILMIVYALVFVYYKRSLITLKGTMLVFGVISGIGVIEFAMMYYAGEIKNAILTLASFCNFLSV